MFKKKHVLTPRKETLEILCEYEKDIYFVAVNKYTNFNNELPSLCMHVQIERKIPTDTANIYEKIYGFDDGLKSACMHIVHVCLCVFFADTMLQYQHFHVLMM